VRLLPAAHRAGVRRLAMEALVPTFAADANATRVVPAAAGGYLAQPEMRELIATALDLGWQLVAYEADLAEKPAEFAELSIEETNWREDQQALNLEAALQTIPASDRLLVWCGNHHLAKRRASDWVAMAVRFHERTQVEPFAIDQAASVRFRDDEPYAKQWVDAYATEIEALGGAAGFLSDEAPDGWPSREIADAFLLALDNDLE
jgi:hypothetical protein